MTTDEILHKLGNCDEVIELATTPGRLFILVANLQLAIRHPENTGASVAIAREMAENLTQMICSKIPEARILIEEGWQPEFDLTREEFQEFIMQPPDEPLDDEEWQEQQLLEQQIEEAKTATEIGNPYQFQFSSHEPPDEPQ